MAPETILVIEDDPTLSRVLLDNFEFEGWSVRVAADGKRGWQAARQIRPALIILDIMLPGMDGFEICRRLRRERFTAPILMLTAKGQESDIVRGLNLGADDYVTKPFSLEVLMARARACLRRRRSEPRRVIEFGGCQLDTVACRFLRKGIVVDLTPKEYRLLAYFARSAGRALTRDQILDEVWGRDLIVTQRSVDRCVTTLRNKIEPDPDHPTFIQTIRDIGYRFEGGEAV